MIARYITKSDAVLIIALLIMSLAGFMAAGRFGAGGKHVVVEVDGKRVLEMPLDIDAREAVAGPLGDTVIVIEKGKTHIESSPCPNHHCIHMGDISHCGELLVCIPNRVLVSIKGGREEDRFDGVTQ